MSEPRDWDRVFREDLAADATAERGLLTKEILVVAMMIALVVVRQLFREFW